VNDEEQYHDGYLIQLPVGWMREDDVSRLADKVLDAARDFQTHTGHVWNPLSVTWKPVPWPKL
jgi:hypothetical protein